MIYPGLTTGSPYISYSKLGPCGAVLASSPMDRLAHSNAFSAVFSLQVEQHKISYLSRNNIVRRIRNILFSYIIGSLFASLLSFIAISLFILFILFILYGLFRLFRRLTHRETRTVNEQHVFYVQRRYRIRVYGL
ncbi:uncharacterized protein LOC110840282 isoform X1 [Zootermopsis nevadensis]|uniref:uncharacterized protein LOC110840282 isoform X1 n=1 Tax=Zootermopsis nevadensis TaxID=136037 RepID=UPI000B8E7614|nr:uncharacterized protein LOC110840282 isoform X1 [Zootermopsis nevadensis]